LTLKRVGELAGVDDLIP